ncbi:MAG TPA: hypothetical protein DD415_04605 [Clostridiales bacterium]|nr:hypothetical protein [Clostridiales bacterium]
MSTITDYLYALAQKDGEAPLLFDEHKSYTAATALKTVEAYARALYGAGIREGDLVALQCKRKPETVLLMYAIMSVGGVAVLCDPHGAVNKFIVNTGVEMQVAANIEYADEKPCLLRGDCANAFVPDFSDGVFPLSSDGERPAMIIFTSGSTGVSKAVTLSQKNMIVNAENTVLADWYLQPERGMIITPINHLLGLLMTFCCTVAGYPLFFPAHTNPEYLMSSIEKYSITFIHGVPTTYVTAAEFAGRKNYDVSSLKCGLMSGGACPPEQFKRLETALNMTIIHAYGMSETGGITTMSRYDGFDFRASGTGRPFASMQVKIANENGEPLPVGDVGEICVKSPTVMLGYYNDPVATAAAFDKDGWFKTGDLGYFDENGSLSISGRIKDIIIRGGENLSCGKIERALCNLGGVHMAAVVGVKDEKYGEIPCAMVAVADGVKESDIKDALRDVLLKNEIPEKILTVKKLPLLPSGKPDKQTVKKFFER